MVFVLAWLAVSAIAAIAFAFGASVGYRRGLEHAVGVSADGGALAGGASPDLAVEVRLPEGAQHAP